MIDTDRLLLRPWRAETLHILRGFNEDAVLMTHFSPERSAGDMNARFARMRHWEETLGFTFWAVIRRDDGEIIGSCGLKPLTIAWDRPDDIEIGWLIRQDCWGQGYAREAASAVLAHGLTIAPRVIAMTAQSNAPSRGLMQRLGMHQLADRDFDYPGYPDDHFARRHLVCAKEA